MPNIYIRLPISRCQFYRNRDPNNPLQPNEPIKFSEYSEAHYVIRNSIYNNALATKYDSRFFSHQEWNNMLRGKDPLGRKVIVKRKPLSWLDYSDIVNIMGEKTYSKTQSLDYLCIKLPNEVFCIDFVKNVCPTWNIDKYGYERLYSIINNDFKRAVIEWVLATFDYCTSGGRIVLRAQQAMLERFLIRYNIYPSKEEKESLRRVIDRWIKQEQCNYTSYSSFDMNYNDGKERKASIDAVEWM